MQITVEAKIESLCVPVRQTLEQLGYSTELVRNALNSHLGKLKMEQNKDTTRGDGKYNAKKDTFKMTVKPGSCVVNGTAVVPAQFIAWHDAVKKAHDIASMETVSMPKSFIEWLVFALPKQTPVAA